MIRHLPGWKRQSYTQEAVMEGSIWEVGRWQGTCQGTENQHGPQYVLCLPCFLA